MIEQDCSILHRILEQARQLLSLLLSTRRIQVRCQLEHSRLRNSALHQHVNVRVLEAQRLQTSRLVAKTDEELRQSLAKDFSRALLLDLGDVDAKGFGHEG
jgi:hypothetical protein